MSKTANITLARRLTEPITAALKTEVTLNCFLTEMYFSVFVLLK